jgi:site-specific recombinase XerD
MSVINESDLFFGWVRDFLSIRLKKHEMRSENTVSAYRQGLNAFRRYLSDVCGIGIRKVTFEMVTPELIREFMYWMIETAQLAKSTANHRLACIKAYMHYCAERDVSLVGLLIALDRVKYFKVRAKTGNWMSKAAVKALLDQPPKTKRGLRDRFLMVFLYSTGARISEALNVCLKDMEMTPSEPFVRLIGKGNKPRCVPLLDAALENLGYYLELFHPNGEPDDCLFYTVIRGTRGKMSVANAERLIKKYGKECKKSCPEIQDNVHPHLLRHSYGAHLYRMGFPLPVIAKLLDHASLQTTEIYAETDSEMVSAAIRSVTEQESEPLEKKWKNLDENALAKLYGLV